MKRVLACVLILAPACDAEKSATPEPSSTAQKSAPVASISAAPSATAVAPVSPPASASVTPSASSSAAPSTSSSAAAADVLSPAKSTLPPESAWETAPEVTVTLSARFACKTMHLAEYFRVRCTAKATGGLPEPELLTRSDRRVAKAPDAVSITLPYVDNESVAVRLAWKDETATLVVHGRAKPRENEPFGIFYLAPPKNEQTGPNCPADTVRGPEDYCLVACTSLPVDTCPSSHACQASDVDGQGATCVPNGKQW